MNRSLSILFTLIAVTVCGMLVPASAGAQEEGSEVTVRKDGDFVVLTPRKPGKVFLVFGYPRANNLQKSTACHPSQITYLVEEERFPAKEFSMITILPVERLTEVDLESDPSGWRVTEKPAELPVNPKPSKVKPEPCRSDKILPVNPKPEPCRCDKILPPPPPCTADDLP